MAKKTRSKQAARRVPVVITRPGPGLPTLPRRPLKPPMETALDSFATELRREIDRLTDAVETLAEALATLSQQQADLKARFEQHTHGYSFGNPGSGGQLWIGLGLLRNYLDGDKTNLDQYGVYFRGGPVAGNPSPPQTDPPGA